MGDRGNVKWIDRDGGVIHFYTHWEGSHLEETVAAALERGRERWGDDQYLARIVFCEMVKGDPMRSTGYGISTYIGDGGRRIVTVDTKKKTVTDFDGTALTFEGFVAKHLTTQ